MKEVVVVGDCGQVGLISVSRYAFTVPFNEYQG